MPCFLSVCVWIQLIRYRTYFSSRQPKAGSVVRPSTISNDFSSATAGLVVTKFHIQPPGPLGKKNYSNGLDHVTKMAAMPIYGKNL